MELRLKGGVLKNELIEPLPDDIIQLEVQRIVFLDNRDRPRGYLPELRSMAVDVFLLVKDISPTQEHAT